jgi:hypothetical protein
MSEPRRRVARGAAVALVLVGLATAALLFADRGPDPVGIVEEPAAGPVSRPAVPQSGSQPAVVEDRDDNDGQPPTTEEVPEEPLEVAATPDGVFDAGYGVIVVSDDIVGSVTATPVEIDTPFDGTTWLTRVFDVSVDGRFDGAAEVWLPLAAAIDDDTIVIGVHAQDQQAAFEVLPSRVDGQHVVITTTSFSLLGGLRASAESMIDTMRRDIFDPLTADLAARADHPSCDGEDEARTEGYAITSSDGPTVYWCFGSIDGRRLLKVTNNRAYPLLLSAGGMTVDQPPAPMAGAARVAQGFAAGGVALGPRKTVVYAVDLEPRARATVTTEWDGVAASLYQLQVGIETVVAILNRFGVGGPEVGEVVGTVLDVGGCVELLLDVNELRGGELLTRCLSGEVLRDAFGWRGVLAGAVFTTASVASYFSSQLSVVTDAVRSDVAVNYLIEVTRAEVPQVPPTTVVEVVPFDEEGNLVEGWEVVDDGFAGTVDCRFDSPSHVSVGVDVTSCSPTAAGADVCWVLPDRVGLACGGVPWERRLHARYAEAPVGPVGLADEPLPWGIELLDGTHCRRRYGGSWGGRADGLNGLFWCERDGSFLGEGEVILGLLDTSEPTWIALRGPLSPDNRAFPPPEAVPITTAWYAGSP